MLQIHMKSFNSSNYLPMVLTQNSILELCIQDHSKGKIGVEGLTEIFLASKD